MNGNGSVRKQISFVLLLLVLTTIAGTLGYHLLEGWSYLDSFYMTVITITTTGYGEVGKLSTSGRFLSMFLMVFGVGIFFYALNSIMPILIEKRRERWREMLERIQNHCIICGYGKIGLEISKELPKEDLVIVDLDPNKIALARENGLLAVHGDATEEEALEKAGVRRAKTLIACTERDSSNAFAVMIAKDLNPKIHTIAILRTPSGEKKLRRVGVDTLLSPYKDVARKASIAVRNPCIVDFIEIVGKKGTLLLRKLELLNEEFFGKTLAETDLRKRTGCIVVTIERDGDMLFPTPGTKLDPKDTLYVLGTEENLQLAEKLITSP